MLLAVGLIIIGVVLLVLGGESLLRGAVGLATLMRLTPAVIGLTVVAAGTSVPELAVSAIAALQGKSDIAVANVVGSNIFNLAFILGLVAVIQPLKISGNTIRLEYPVLALVTLLCVALCNDGGINRIDAALCIAIYVCFTAYMVGLVRQQMSEVERREFKQEVEELKEATAAPPRLSVGLGLLALGVALLALGAQATVNGAVEIARTLGWSERVIGLTIVSVGTGLPEVVASVVSSFRGRNDVAIGNVIGSNLFNILGILGISAMVAPLRVDPALIHADNYWMLGVTLLLLPILATGSRISRREGALLLTVYFVYLAVLLSRPA